MTEILNNFRGVHLIAEFVRHLPNKPGVYRMADKNGDVLYVGKARNLKKPVTSYTRPESNASRIARMICMTANMEFVVTRTETEALFLEANLIKRLSKRFNVLLQDDKSFPYIIITNHHRTIGFASAGAVNQTISSLQRAFLLRTCTDSVFEVRSRPCLLYQIKRCSGPCTDEISREDYALLIKETKAFLSSKSRNVRNHITEAMHEAADRMDFEWAAIYRDRLAALTHIQTRQGINPQTIDEADIFAIWQDGGLVSIHVFFFRTGQNWGNRVYFPKADPSLPASEVLEAFSCSVL